MIRKNLSDVIKHLKRCAKQNESDGEMYFSGRRDWGVAQAGAVAAEQRRMIRILRNVLNGTPIRLNTEDGLS